ncbi:MAG: toprim domain-containing protein [Aquabacterium sp.]|nr:toprim domain-containing protein [Aquabacterium sp.]
MRAFRGAVLGMLGAAPEEIEPGCLHRFSTNGRRGDVSGWCKLFADMRGGVFGDWRAGITETWSARERQAMTGAERAELDRQVAAAAAERVAQQRREWATNAQRIDDLLRLHARPVTEGDPVAQYLASRGLGAAWPPPPCLRLVPALPYWHEGECLGQWPAMLAPLTAPDGRIVALHRTWLTDDGAKAPVPTVRKLTRTAGPLAGASIALHLPRRGVIGIAEGIETALAAGLGSGVPTVAAYSAGSLAAWQWPQGVRRVLVFADHDPTGRDAARALRQRARAAGLAAEIHAPSQAGADWCDVWSARPHATKHEGPHAT